MSVAEAQAEDVDKAVKAAREVSAGLPLAIRNLCSLPKWMCSIDGDSTRALSARPLPLHESLRYGSDVVYFTPGSCEKACCH